MDDIDEASSPLNVPIHDAINDVDKRDFSAVTWDDVEYEERNVTVKGKETLTSIATRIKGVDVKDIAVVPFLRQVVKVLKITGARSKSKTEVLVLIGQRKAILQAYNASGQAADNPYTTTKGIQCPFTCISNVSIAASRFAL